MRFNRMKSGKSTAQICPRNPRHPWFSFKYWWFVLACLLGNAEMAQALVPTNWVVRTSGTSRDLHSVVYARGQFVAVGQQGLVLTSTNGIHWTPQNSGVDLDLTGITYGHGLYVAVGQSSACLVRHQ
jgi:hypothetical protein